MEGRFWLQQRCQRGPTRCATVVLTDARALHAQARQERLASLAALRGAIERLSRARSRKTVLFLSEGFPHDQGEEPVREVVRAAQRVNAAMYFVDVRGVVVAPPWGSADVGNDADPDLGNMGSGEAHRIAELIARATRERLRVERYVGVETMADETGGTILRGTNDLASGLARIAAESRSYYLLGYRPATTAPESVFRTIQVKVRRPGLTVRARKGYLPAGSTRATAPAPDALTDVPMRLSTYTLEPVAGGKTRVAATVEVDIAPTSGDRASRFDLHVEAIPGNGEAGAAQNLSLESPRGSPAPDWRRARVEFELPAGLHQVRARALETSSGRAGVVAQRVDVPDPAAFRVSTPILSDAATAPSGDGGNPQPIAIAHRTFAGTSGRPLFCAFEVIGAAADPATGRKQVSVGFNLENAAGNVVAAVPPTPLVPEAGGRLQAVLALPLAQLPAGDYVLDLVTEDRVAKRMQRLRERFTVENAAATAPPAVVPAAASTPAPAVSAELRPILERAGRYVAAYATAFSGVFAEERYDQEYTSPTGRRTVRKSRADVVFVSLPGAVPWTVFRDVTEVDGSPIGDREARLRRLFVESPVTAVEKARTILAESARYNLGPLRRSVNFPMLALTFLLPENQPRFAFDGKGRRSVRGTDTIEVAYLEKARPTIVHDGVRQDVPSRGRFWIDPETGQVLRSVLEQDPNGHDWLAWARIIVEYRREPRLDILVPDSMTESYWDAETSEKNQGAEAAGYYSPDFEAFAVSGAAPSSPRFHLCALLGVRPLQGRNPGVLPAGAASAALAAQRPAEPAIRVPPRIGPGRARPRDIISPLPPHPWNATPSPSSTSAPSTPSSSRAACASCRSTPRSCLPTPRRPRCARGAPRGSSCRAARQRLRQGRAARATGASSTWACPCSGICYGMQLMSHLLGGDVQRAGKREYGHATFEAATARALLHGPARPARVWMSHGDSIVRAAARASPWSGPAETQPGGAVEAADRQLFGILFHPEVNHTEERQDRARELPRRLRLPPRLERGLVHRGRGGEVRGARWASDRVLCALSGGVDSAVAALLVHEAIGDRLTCVFVDNGLLRKDEARAGPQALRGPAEAQGGVRGRLAALPGEAQGRHRSRAQAQDHRARSSSTSSEDATRKVGQDGVPGPGHALSRRDRVHVGARPLRGHQEPPQRGRPAEEAWLQAGRAAARAVQGRGARGGPARSGLDEEFVYRQPFPGPGLAVRCLGPIDRRARSSSCARPTTSW